MQDHHRYRLLALLGHTAIGKVYLAEDTHLCQQVALKVIGSDLLPHFDPQAVHNALLLFQQETQVLARLNQPRLLPLFDYGQVIIKGTLSICFAMSLCPEGSLATWLRERGNPPRLSLDEVHALLSQVAHTLQPAHHQHMHIQAPPPSCFNPQVPAAIDAVVLRALAKRSQERFDSIFTFAHAFYQGLSSTVSSSEAPLHSLVSSATLVPASKAKSTHQVSRARTVGVGLLLLALLLLVGGIGGSIIQFRWMTAPQTTLIAKETASATVTTRGANPNPYPPYNGTLVVDDPMTSDRLNWTVGTTNGATCTFTSSAYQVMGTKKGSVNPCLGEGLLFSNYSNFVFEVRMTISSGTGGGLRFHISSTGSDNFIVYQDGQYALLTDDSSGEYHSTLLRATARSIVKTGVKQTNTIAVAVNGKQIDLYVNNVRIGSAQDAFSSGSFGLLADQESQVAFSNVRLWVW